MIHALILAAALWMPAEDCAVLLDRARQAYEARQFPLAISGFESALAACPRRAPVLLALGEAQLMDQRFAASIASLREVTSLEPRNTSAYKLLGDALYLSGEEIEAEKSLRQAFALDPRFAPARYALGRIYYQQNRFPEAVEQFQKVIEMDPANYRAHDNLGLCFDAMYRDADALRHFLRALDLVTKDHPEYDWAHANLAEFFLKRNQFEKAFQLAAEAAHRNPESARDCFLTGKALIGLRKDELSLRWLERAVALDPKYREAHYLLARTCQKLGRREEAAREYAKFRAIAQDPAGRR